MDPSTLNPWAILVAALSTFLIGGVWYSPLLFAKPWMQMNGLRDDDLRKANPGVTFGGSFALALVSALNLACFLGPTATVSWGLAAGALAGVGWVATSLGTTYLFERKPMKLYFINAGYHAISFPLMGAILAAWR